MKIITLLQARSLLWLAGALLSMAVGVFLVQQISTVFAQQGNLQDSFVIETHDSDSDLSAVVTQSIFEEPVFCLRESSSQSELTLEERRGSAQIFEVDQSFLLSYIANGVQGQHEQTNADLEQYQLISEESSLYLPASGCADVTLPTEAAGIYAVQFTFADELTTYLIVRSSFGVLATEGRDEIVFWGQEYESGQELDQATVEVYSFDQSAQVVSQDTFSEGVASVARSNSADIALVRSGEELALIPMQLQYFRREEFNQRSIRFGERVPKYTSMTFTDRPLYQPGDQVFFSSLIRTDDDVRFSIPTGVVTVTINGPDYDEPPLYEEQLTISDTGKIDGSFTLPDDAPVGNYRITVDEGNALNWRGNTRFVVSRFRKPEFTLDIEAEPLIIVQGDEINYEAIGSYLSGQRMRNESVRISASVSRSFITGYASKQYEPEDLANISRYGLRSDEEVYAVDGMLDDEGVYTETIDTRTLRYQDDTFPKIMTISASKDAQTGTTNTAAANVLVYSGEYRILRTDSYRMVPEGSDLEIPLILNENVETDIAGRQLEVTVKRSIWTMTGDPEEKRSVRYRREDFQLDPQTLTTDQTGSTMINVPDVAPGQYEFVITGTDDRGNTIRQVLSQYVSGADGAFYRSEDRPVTVETSTDTYRPGDTIDVVISSQLPDRTALLTVDRGSTQRYYQVELTNGVGTLEIPVVETDMPSIFLSAHQFSEDEMEFGTKGIHISAEQQELQVELETNDTEFGPGETVELTVRTTDAQGNPVPGDVTVWSVDKAIFEMVETAPDELYDAFDAFWYQRGNNTAKSYSLVNISDNWTGAGGGCFAAGTQILMADGSTQPIEEVAVGDRVLTRTSETDATLVEAAVTDTHVQQADGYLIVNEQLRITPNHILYINGNWQEAATIQIGDIYLDTDGNERTVTSVAWQRGQSDVYHLTIDTYHTHFADGVWVHNQKGMAPRSEFKDTAYWNPSVRTGVDGTATVTYTLPDNLTTWVVAGVGITTDTKAGMVTEEIVVSKDTVVRPILPNYLRVGDQTELGALAHNFDNQPHQFTASISATAVSITDPVVSSFEIDAGAMETLNWAVVPEQATDSATFGFWLTAENMPQEERSEYRDAVELELPIVKKGFHDRSTVLGHNQSDLPIEVGGPFDPTESEITLYLSTNLWGTVSDRFSYLMQYPYGCNEQITSRLHPLLSSQLSTEGFRQLTESERIDVDEAIEEGLSQLAARQAYNGGWGWWRQSEDNMFITVYILEALVKADQLGYDVSSMVLSAGRYLSGSDPSNSDEEVMQEYGKMLLSEMRNTSSDTEGNDGVSDLAPQPITEFIGLDPQMMSMAVVLNYRLGITDPDQNGLTKLKELSGKEGDKAFWPAGNPDYFGSEYASTARAVNALLEVDSSSEFIEQGIRSLVEDSYQSFSRTTYRSALIFDLAATYYQVADEESSPVSFVVYLDQEEIATRELTRFDDLIEPIDIPPEMLAQSGSTISIEQSGASDLFTTLTTDFFRTDLPEAAQTGELSISQQYVNRTVENSSLAPGDVVEVTFQISGVSGDQRYLLIEDELPAGLIPVDTGLANQRSIGQSDSRDGSVKWADVRVTERGAELYIPNPSGRNGRYKYLARVVSAGEFYDPPARVELMYQPQTHARTETTMINVSDDRTITAMPSKNADERSSEKKLPDWIGVGIFLTILAMVIIGFRFYRMLPEETQKRHRTIVQKKVTQLKHWLKSLNSSD